MPPVIIGATIAGAAGLGAAAIASSGAKSAAQTQADAQAQALKAQKDAAAQAAAERAKAVQMKQDAAANINFPTYLETPEAQTYKKTLEDRMSGLGLVDVDAQTAPVAAQVRAGLNQTNAAIGSGASARGLGRSSIATSQLGAASQAAERDIAERMQQLELVKQEQKGQAVSQFGTLSEQEAISQQNKAQFKLGNEFNIADTVAGNAEATKSDQFAISNTMQVSGASQAAWQLKSAEIWASAMVGLSKSATDVTDDIVSAIEAQQATKQSGALVNIGNSRLVNNPNVNVGLSNRDLSSGINVNNF